MTNNVTVVGNWKKLIPTLLSYAASSGSLIAANAAQLLTFAILARSLGANEFGLFVTIIALTSIATYICGLGAAECLVRRVAQDRAIYPAMLGHNLILITISGIVLVILGTLLLPFWWILSPNNTANLIGIFLMLVTNIVLVRLILLAEQIYIAHSNFQAANLCVVGFALARTIAAVVACFVFDVSSVLGWAYWQFACHVLVALLYAAILLKLGKPDYRIIREEIRLGLLFASQFIFRAIRQNVDLLLLSALMPAGIIGSYGVTRRIIDSSMLTIEAMNRLVYPRLAVASAKGMHHALPTTRKLFVAALFIGAATSLGIFIIAPYLPLLFGAEYDMLVYFCQILCWTSIFVALWSVPIDALGAAGQHGYRTVILNTANILGAPLLALATWLYPPEGTFASIYLIEIGIMAAAWIIFLRLVRRSQLAEQELR